MELEGYRKLRKLTIDIGLVQTLHPGLKWIHWQLDKLVLKVASCLDKNDDISHLAELDTQEADSPKCSTTMPKVVVGGPRVLKVFSWIFIYIFHKNMVLGPKKSVKPD